MVLLGRYWLNSGETIMATTRPSNPTPTERDNTMVFVIIAIIIIGIILAALWRAGNDPNNNAADGDGALTTIVAPDTDAGTGGDTGGGVVATDVGAGTGADAVATDAGTGAGTGGDTSGEPTAEPTTGG
jgi:hypothetical protein